MAGGPGQTDELQALRARLEESRRDLGLAVIGLRRRFDVPARLRLSMRQHPRGWFTGSLVAGLLAAISVRRRGGGRRERRGRGWLAGLAAFVLSILKPLLKRWLTRRFLG